MPESENSYYNPTIISTITCAVLMRVQFVSVRRFISLTAQSKRVFHHMFSLADGNEHVETKFDQPMQFDTLLS